MERDGEAPCDVASEAVKQQIKLDLFEHEAGEKAFVPADMAKAALAPGVLSALDKELIALAIGDAIEREFLGVPIALRPAAFEFGTGFLVDRRAHV